ncbi:hypothetical protein [Micromonospora auratinigra]|uniref:Nitrate and nitrite sensing n=1 Tax=Micromonospora auratinigra TaxID=261654 RepID=A0A1A8ZWU8_9ACTN|nr:hypothetical protein [Micromonospora auratinigra]SBT48608.1 hypothetical protein GA0070611_4121 [Micromonospora auratinigra]
MTVPAPRVRRRPSLAGRALPLLLVVTLLAPLGLLFTQASRHTGDDRDLAARERLGVRYLRALAPVTDAVVEAQSTAVGGGQVSRAALTAAVEQAARVDDEVGDELRSHERWAGLRAKLEALPDRGLADPAAAYQAYGEVTDLLLALYRKVRESSGLIRDPQPDSFFLQDGIGGDLPTATVYAGRLMDVLRMAPRRPASERAKTGAELAGLQVAALGPATDLVADLRAAVDDSESTDLGANVLTPLDTYQRSIEAFAAYSTPTAARSTPDLTQLSASGSSAQAAAKQLRAVILDQLDDLLTARIDRLDRDRLVNLAAVGTAALLLVALTWLLLAALGRARRQAATDRDASVDRDAAPPEQGGPGRLPAAGDGRLQPVGAGRRGEPERWGPFDAAR